MWGGEGVVMGAQNSSLINAHGITGPGKQECGKKVGGLGKRVWMRVGCGVWEV